MSENVIKISTGLKKYDIADISGSVLGSFYFNPADVDMISRYESAMNGFEEKIREVQNEKNSSDFEKYEKMKTIAYDLIDGVFNSKVSENFFSIMSPFTILEDGKSFFEATIEAIGSVIEIETGKRFKKANERILKHTQKYK